MRARSVVSHHRLRVRPQLDPHPKMRLKVLFGTMAPHCLLLMVDDLDAEASGPCFRQAGSGISRVAGSRCGPPISWHKLRGGTSLQWSGFQLGLSDYSLGISENRAAWIVRWCARTREAGEVNTSAMQEAIGRFAFVSGVIIHFHAFLSPFHAL